MAQRYLSDPYLVGGRKFDLRLYAVVTSYHPMKVLLAASARQSCFPLTAVNVSAAAAAAVPDIDCAAGEGGLGARLSRPAWDALPDFAECCTVVGTSQVWFYREGFARFTKNRYSSAKVRLALRSSPLVFLDGR